MTADKKGKVAIGSIYSEYLTFSAIFSNKVLGEKGHFTMDDIQLVNYAKVGSCTEAVD